MEYYEKYVGFDELSICYTVMRIRVLDYRLLKIKEREGERERERERERVI